MIYKACLEDSDGLYLASRLKGFRRDVFRTPFIGRYMDVDDPTMSLAYQKQQYCEKNPDASRQTVVAGLAPQLLCVSRQINAEATAMLYGQNIVVENLHTLYTVLAKLRPGTLNLIQTITIEGWGCTKAERAMNFPALSMLSKCENLERVDIDCQIFDRHWWSTSKKRCEASARRFYKDAFNWLEDMAGKAGRKDAALDIVRFHRINYSSPSDDNEFENNEARKEYMKGYMMKLMR